MCVLIVEKPDEELVNQLAIYHSFILGGTSKPFLSISVT